MRKWICFMILVNGMISLTACGTRDDSDDFMSQTVTEVKSEMDQETETADVTEEAQKDADSEMGTEETQTDMERTGIVAATSENIENNDKITENENRIETETQEQLRQEEITEMKVEVNGYIFYATLEKNDAVIELVEMMREQPVVINMSDYSGFEKVGSLGTTLSSSNSQTTTKAGDIVLYNSNQIVVFYGSNSWSYTRIGHITDLTGWKEALGAGDVTITFSID